MYTKFMWGFEKSVVGSTKIRPLNLALRDKSYEYEQNSHF